MSVFGLGRRPPEEPPPPARDRRPRLDGVPVDAVPDPLPQVARGRRRPIAVIGESVLRRPCRRVATFDDELAATIDDMFATMAVADGVGLAANQIGLDLRLFVYDCPDTWDVRHVGHIVNPVLVSADAAEPTLTRDEGCLSVPGPVASLTRPAAATVNGVDLHGNPVRVTGHGLFARCLQHECDHLDGRLYVDRLPGRTRRAVLREMDQIKDDVWAHWGERAAALGKV